MVVDGGIHVRNALRAAAIAVAVMVPSLSWGPPAEAIGEHSYAGLVGLVGAEYCPQYAMEADGRLLDVRQHQVLFSLIGNTYGGDVAKYTFALPDLRGKEPMPGVLYCIVVDGLYPTKAAP